MKLDFLEVVKEWLDALTLLKSGTVTGPDSDFLKEKIARLEDQLHYMMPVINERLSILEQQVKNRVSEMKNTECDALH